MSSTIDSLRELKVAYKRYFANPKPTLPERWLLCESCFERTIRTLSSPEIASAVDPLISEAIVDAQASTAMAASNLSPRFEPRIEELERRLGRQLGYSESELDKYFSSARAALESAVSRQVALDVPASSQDLVDRLDAMHNQVRFVFHAPREQLPRRTKRALRGQVREHAQRELYAVAVLVSGALYAAESFPLTLALSIGVAGSEASRRRHLARDVKPLLRSVA